MSALLLSGRETLVRLFEMKVRGVRWVELIGAVLVAVMIVSVYAAKAGAARESSRIAQLEQDIAENGQRVRLLRAEAARLEQPARLESLSRQIGMAPVDVHRQADETALPALKAPQADLSDKAVAPPSPPPAPAQDAAPVAAPPAEEAQ
ncbi:cell division protein [Brevundimonas sp. PAMC22021]|uniref:cell division protein FtsL n=1 Tax=Brevundimonas sp. PAMC22021 TaxID=2861285 RepID=UPI001C62DDF8|nr:cell division protein [Brevundimonas sp. PAMC22021]QYF87289.1 cell division protein [Brevundimonas sp. PAMC22021]